MKLNEFLDWLDSFLNFEKKAIKNIFWLDTMKFLCSKFDNPQNAIPAIHIAGSKGKGSVAKMTACIIEQTGKTCGIYTSPHISDYRERVCLSSGFFSDEIYEKAAEELYENFNKIPKEEFPGNRTVTWFELTTLYAFLCFRLAKVDYAVYETGLGGRLDSTNVIKPIVSILTAIELEHTEFLGNTIEKIAKEKAGIIKPHIPVVIGIQKYKKAVRVFKVCARNNNSLYTYVYSLIKKMKISLKDKKTEVSFYHKLFKQTIHTTLLMNGSIQAYNAATAATAVKIAIPEVTKEQIELGLAKAFLPARFEKIQLYGKYKDLTVIVDGAHTPNSIKQTVKTLKLMYPQTKPMLLFACAADKDVKKIASILKRKISHAIITKPGYTKHNDISKTRKAFSDKKIIFSEEEDTKKAVKTALEIALKHNELLLITGSFYLIAEVKKLIET